LLTIFKVCQIKAETIVLILETHCEEDCFNHIGMFDTHISRLILLGWISKKNTNWDKQQEWSTQRPLAMQSVGIE